MFGSEKVILTNEGIDTRRIPIYVINSKPANVKAFNMKPTSIKVEVEKGEIGKYKQCWIGNHEGKPIIFAEGADYGEIVKEFSKTKRFKGIIGDKGNIKANIEVIEVDMDNKEAEINYSESGNVLVGLNKVIGDNGEIDIEKQISLLNNSKVEAVTVNQNIAVYIDDIDDKRDKSNKTYEEIKKTIKDTISSYIKDNKLGTQAKVIFSNRYIDKIIELLKKEKGSDKKAKQELKKMIQELKEDNKEIIVIFEEDNKGDYIKEEYKKYQEYGISSYVAKDKYVDCITGEEKGTKYVSNLDEIDGFDGKLLIVKVSKIKKELDKTSGIYELLTNKIKIKDILERRNKGFIKEVAKNFDYNQIPEIGVKEVLSMIGLSYTEKRKKISSYLEETGIRDILTYLEGIKGEEEKKIFIEEITKRILVVNYIREKDREEGKEYSYGLKDKKMEDVLAKALVKKYEKEGNLEIISEKKLNEDLKGEEIKEEKLISVYAERKVELRTAEVKVADIQNIKGMLSAA